MEEIGIPQARVEKTLESQAFDHIWATYYLIADQLTPRNPIESEPQPAVTSRGSHKVAAPVILEEEEEEEEEGSLADFPHTPNSASPVATVVAPAVTAPSSQEARAMSPPRVVLAERDKKSRRHTANPQVDVSQVRKEMAAKKLAKVDTGSGGFGPTSPSQSPLSSPPSPISPSAYDTEPPSPSSEFALPIPRNTKDRRVRALSLATRPASVYATATSSAVPSTLNPGRDNSPSISHAASIALPNNTSDAKPSATSPTNKTRGLFSLTPGAAQSRSSKFQTIARRPSFKDKFRKTLGLAIKEVSEEAHAEPKTVRFHFSVSTTSSKPPKEIVDEIERVMALFEVAHERDAFLFLARKGNVAFEIEICKLPRLALNGLRIKRLAGDSWEYKNLCSDMVSKMKL